MRAVTKAVTAVGVSVALVAGGAVVWPSIEPHATDIMALAGGLVDVAAADEAPTGTVTPAPPVGQSQTGGALLDELRGPLRPAAGPADLSTAEGATDAQAAAATARIRSLLGGAEVNLSGLASPSAEADRLTDSLTGGAATAGVRDAAANQVVVRIAGAYDHAADVLGPQLLAASYTKLEARRMGAPVPGTIAIRQVDALFQWAFLPIPGMVAIDAILGLNSDTFGSFGLDAQGRLRPVVDLTYDSDGYRVAVLGGGVEATIWHETGHAVFALAGRANYGTGHWTSSPAGIEAHLRSVVGSAAWNARATQVSAYGAENVQELIAECFAEYLGAESPRPFARAVVRTVLDAIRTAPPAALALATPVR